MSGKAGIKPAFSCQNIRIASEGDSARLHGKGWVVSSGVPQIDRACGTVFA